MGESKGRITKGHEELLRVIEMLILNVVMVSWLYTYVRTHWSLHFQMPFHCTSISPQWSYIKMEYFLSNISIVTIYPTWIYHSWSVIHKGNIIFVTFGLATQIVVWEPAVLTLTESLSETLNLFTSSSATPELLIRACILKRSPGDLHAH